MLLIAFGVFDRQRKILSIAAPFRVRSLADYNDSDVARHSHRCRQLENVTFVAGETAC